MIDGDGMALSRKVQNRLIIAGAVVALLLGIALLAYPFVSNALLDSAQGKVLHTQQDAVANSSEEDLSAAREFALQYNRDLVGSRTVVTDPFDETALRPTNGSYDEALNIAGDGVMGTLYIPKIQVEEPIYHTVDDEVLQKGVGHLEETSLPIGGPSSHCVLSGHTGLPSGKIFDDLDRLEVGDYFIIQVLGEDHAYRIYDIETVLPDETQSLVIQPDRDLCTLVTCTPYGVNTHRLLVHGERCDVPAEWLERDADETFPSGYSQPIDRTIVPSVLLGLLLAAILIGATTAVLRYRAKRGQGVRLGTTGRSAADARWKHAAVRVMPALGKGASGNAVTGKATAGRAATGKAVPGSASPSGGSAASRMKHNDDASHCVKRRGVATHSAKPSNAPQHFADKRMRAAGSTGKAAQDGRHFRGKA